MIQICVNCNTMPGYPHSEDCKGPQFYESTDQHLEAFSQVEEPQDEDHIENPEEEE